MAKVVVVNDRDEVLGYKERSERTEADIIRVSGLWIFNDNKEALIAQRAHDKLHDPSKWGPSVAGTVEEGETYVANIIKEAREEIGLTLQEQDLVLGPHRFFHSSHQYFYQSFFTRVNLPLSAFAVRKEEVAEIRLVPIGQLIAWVKEKPNDFIASFRTPEASLYDLARFLEGK